MVPPTSHGIPRVPRYSGSSWIQIPFAYVALTLCGRPSHAVLLRILTLVAVRNPANIATAGLASSAFARHYSRNLGWCLFLALLRCFSSGGSPPIPIWFSIGYLAVGFPIRKSPDHCSFAAPRSLSQLITSFIGSWCQGIPLALFFAWPLIVLPISVNHIRKVNLLVLYYSWIMQAHYRISVFLAKIVFLPLQMIFKMSICKTFSLLLPSHNCIIIHNVQFSRCIWVPYF